MDMQALKCEMSRTMGVLVMAYAMIRDQLLDPDNNQEKAYKIDDVMSDTINGLNQALESLPDDDIGLHQPEDFGEYEGFRGKDVSDKCDCCGKYQDDCLQFRNVFGCWQTYCRRCLTNRMGEFGNERSTAD